MLNYKLANSVWKIATNVKIVQVVMYVILSIFSILRRISAFKDAKMDNISISIITNKDSVKIVTQGVKNVKNMDIVQNVVILITIY